MVKSGAIINLTAGRGNGKGMALAEALRKNPHVKVLHNFSELRPALTDLAAACVDDLFISSGDGTIQAIATVLVETKLFAKVPRLCILSHGTTNLTAIDVGFKHRSIVAQADFIAKGQTTTIKQRHSLKVINPRGENPRHGFSFGAGASARATKLVQTDFNDKGRKGQAAAFLMILNAVGHALFTKPDHDDKKRVDRPYRINAEVDGTTLCDGDQLMFVATTLERQFFNARPFWGGKHGPIRASAFAYPPPNLMRWLWPIMYGAEDRKMPVGAVSNSGNTFSITCDEPYVMDGEFFYGPLDEPLRVETGPKIEFIID